MGRVLLPRLPVKKDALSKLRFRTDSIDNLIETKGWHLQWEQGARCPCRESVDSDHPRPDCPVCDGIGWDWHTSQEVRALVTNANQDTAPLERPGQWARGNVILTMHSEQLPGYQDRLTALAHVFVFRDFGVRGTGASDRLRYRVAQRTLDLVGGAQTFGVLHLRLAAEDGTADADGVRAEGTHFDVVDGRIAWRAGEGPPVGRRYAVSYYAHPRFVVVEDHYSTRDTWKWTKVAPDNRPTLESLPVRVMAKLDYEGDL